MTNTGAGPLALTVRLPSPCVVGIPSLGPLVHARKYLGCDTSIHNPEFSDIIYTFPTVMTNIDYQFGKIGDHHENKPLEMAVEHYLNWVS